MLIFDRLRREHEKVREETVKAIVTEQKLEEDAKHIKLESEDIARVRSGCVFSDKFIDLCICLIVV